ncbi:hypothetical protein PF049_02990 [Erythrobacteraceae bacterium WH01K]|nr:hypothetical protein PF049_02990 [Erythrobacteraceae bacterium WH01K]
MNGYLASIACAFAMILVALGIRQGGVDADTGTLLMLTLPAIAVSLSARKKCNLPFVKGRC